MGIIVQRQPADKPGDEIISSILTTAAAQLERGTHAINETSVDRQKIVGTTMDTNHVQPGSMISVDNRGSVKTGLLTSYSGSLTLQGGLNIRRQLTIEVIK